MLIALVAPLSLGLTREMLVDERVVGLATVLVATKVLVVALGLLMGTVRRSVTLQAVVW